MEVLSYIYFLLILFVKVDCRILSSKWINDKSDIHSSFKKNGPRAWFNYVQVSLNGNIYIDDSYGHLKLNISGDSPSLGRFNSETRCINAAESPVRIEEIVLDTVLLNAKNVVFRVKQILNVNVAVRHDVVGKINDTITLFIHFNSSLELNFKSIITSTGCSAIISDRDWSDKSSWVGGLIPNSSLSAIFPRGTGVVRIPSNVTIRFLNASAGIIYNKKSSCPTGWIPTSSALSR